MRLYGVSDLHTDHAENMQLIANMCSNASQYKDDAIIVAGDLSDDLSTIRKTFQLLKSAFAHVFFIPGNHELWVRKADRDKNVDSLMKLEQILTLCTELEIITTPTKLHSMYIVPLFSWYHSSFDKEPNIPGSCEIEKVLMDFHACSWQSVPSLKSSGDDSLAKYFDAMNDTNSYRRILEEIQKSRKNNDTETNLTVVSFSHFLPLQKLLPSKQWLHFPNLAKACGSDYLAARMDELKSTVHIFGHTHFTQDTVVHGTRYIQWPLGYPKERHTRLVYNGQIGHSSWQPKLIWDSEEQTRGE